MPSNASPVSPASLGGTTPACPREIEYRFLVEDTSWLQGEGVRITQGYLNQDKHRTVRLRIAGDNAYLTIKGLTVNATRPEFEYEIPAAHANELMLLCEGALVEKTRYFVTYEGFLWSVDVFHGLNEGLCIAEIELESEDQPFAKPDWAGPDITREFIYANSSLSVTPYTTWLR